MFIRKNQLVDETSFLQVGQQSEIEYTMIELGADQAVEDNRIWPTKEKPDLYAFSYYFIELDQKVTTIERTTYSFLEWLGDVGGLFDGLKLFIRLLTGPAAAFAMKIELLKHVFNVKDDSFQSFFLHSIKSCCRRKSQFSKLLDRTEHRVARELDLVKFIRH